MNKIILALILTILSWSALAGVKTIEVEAYFKTDMDFMFSIKNKRYDKVILDCQGFINGLNLYSSRGHDIFTLPGYGHCMAIHNEIIKNIKNEKKSCLVLNDKEGQIVVLDNKCPEQK
ncbi:hypothetical protein M902_0454 [Bacteriovorax sp. BAL6_X]|uniref:hypothetical protein n=1 Tax=Bacteriovorax sp. BAL6_X TaxID=1201290 RepID=UPI000386328F|nr:hypothetical protein [Bacteriovorax sp. BAL6_X]EPZ49798.1 hypothetical protein M902_0454 [Bacteriovorax sp. BAL6_X]